MADILLFVVRGFLWGIAATILWLVMFPLVWIVSLLFVLLIAMFRKRPYWRTVVEMVAAVHGFWCDYNWYLFGRPTRS